MLTVGTEINQITGTLTKDHLFILREKISDILEPNRSLEKHLYELKKFKRQVFVNYKKAVDPNEKDKRLALYIESKNLVREIELQLGRED